MSEWRRRALADFPEFRPAIERAQTTHGVFFVLLPALQDAYRTVPPDASLIARIYAYAEWCSAAAGHPDVRGAALASFYEHLPEFGPAWRDLPSRVSRAHLATIREHLRGYLSPVAFEQAMASLDATLRSSPAPHAI